MASRSHLCKFCKVRLTAYSRRGLCQPCYNEPFVRRQYAMLAVVGLGAVSRDTMKSTPAPAGPLPVDRGARLLELERRADLKVGLFPRRGKDR